MTGVNPNIASASEAVGSFLGEFQNPYPNFKCEDAPILEWLKFEGCGYLYIQELPNYLANREKAWEERLEIERARAWVWFVAPPTAESCDIIPALEKAKFSYQCAPRSEGTDALGLFEWELARLQGQRDGLAARLEIVRNDFERLKTRQATSGVLSPRDLESMNELRQILDTLDQVARRESLTRRFALELEGNRGLDLGSVTQIVVEEAPAGLLLKTGSDSGFTEVGSISDTGENVIVIETEDTDAQTVMLVHAEFGLVYVDKSEFYAR
ncbi:hypothetical protein [Roseobacter sp.]|uniref:hypothetical protein n=1 Tax=Roseobacter sp. TaxID=1907202 RepID=UPI00385CE360